MSLVKQIVSFRGFLLRHVISSSSETRGQRRHSVAKVRSVWLILEGGREGDPQQLRFLRASIDDLEGLRTSYIHAIARLH